MYRILLLYTLLLLPLSLLRAQVQGKVPGVQVMNAENDPVELPMLGKKGLLIFYADPNHSKQNRNLQDYFKEHPINSQKIDSYGVVNMAAAPMIPNGLIRKMAVKAVKGTKGQVYFDPDRALSKAWDLKGADDASCVIIVGEDRVIQFFKAGQVTDEEMQKVIDWVKTHR